jgi:hypothetical protein
MAVALPWLSLFALGLVWLWEGGHVWVCAGFRMPAIDIRATSTGGRRPKAAKERTRGE